MLPPKVDTKTAKSDDLSAYLDLTVTRGKGSETVADGDSVHDKPNVVDDIEKDEPTAKSANDLNQLIGEFGLYHLNVMLFTLIRETIYSMDSMVFALSLPSNIHFRCSSSKNPVDTCFYLGNGTTEGCGEWVYLDAHQSHTLTAEWDLVCDRKWLGSIVMAAFFVGLFFGNFFWGYVADKFGRWKGNALSHIGSLIFGGACIFSPSVYWLIFFRFMSAFCSQGYQVLNTLQVEMIGTKYRTFTTISNHLGWGLGAVLLAFIGITTNDWKHLVAIMPSVLLLSLPWLIFLPESIRWMILESKWDLARKEIKRAARYNFMPDEDLLDSRIDEYFANRVPEEEDQPDASLIDLFKNRVFCLNLISLWIALLYVCYIYYSRTFHFAPDTASMMANFMITGIGDWVCLLLAASCMMVLKRKTCLALFVSITGLSFLAEGIIEHTSDLLTSSPPIAYALDASAKISDMSAFMVLLLVSYEVFPTELRNRGASLVMTASALGDASSPFYSLFIIIVGGQLNYSIIMAAMALVVVLLMVFAVTETKGMALQERLGDPTTKADPTPKAVKKDH